MEYDINGIIVKYDTPGIYWHGKEDLHQIFLNGMNMD